MKSIKLCMVIAALCCMVPVMAQKNFGSARYTHMCSYYGEAVTGDITAYEAGASAQNVVKNIMSVIGLKPNFELRAANVPNAAAVMLKNKRYILYNPDYMNKINSATGSSWAAISIFAHEIGHHLNGHTLDNVGSRPQTELEADEFSGFVLHKMGASLTDAQAVMTLIASITGSHSHPAKRDRLAYIATGWNNAGPDTAATAIADKNTNRAAPKATITQAPVVNSPAIAVQKPVSKAPQNNTAAYKKPAAGYSKPVQKEAAPAEQTATVATVNTPSSPRSQKIQQTLLSRNVTSDAYFNDDPGGRYYVTRKGNLVQVQNDKVYLVASLYKSDKKGYSVMFSDEESHKLYVADGGALVNDTGAKVGYVKSR